jgi:large subunit ribosomal protein L13
MKTQTVNPDSVERKWWIIDAKDMVMGRLASTAAHLLMGKHKASYSPLHDHGDYVIIVNAAQAKLTGKKQETKRYFSHSQQPGGWRNLRIKEIEAVRPGASMEAAVKGMLPKNPRGRAIVSKLHIYTGDQHPHAAQKPETLALTAA